MSTKGRFLPENREGAVQNDRLDAIRRLELARKATDLLPQHRDILCDIITAELNDTLTGCYADIPIQVYHNPLCSGYSSTTIKRLIEQSYNHWFVSKNENSKSLRFGSAFHAFCNEPHLFEQDYIVLPFTDKKSADYKAAKKVAGSKIIVDASEFKTIEVMSRKLFEHPDAAPLLKGAQHELTYFSKDAETGLWKKCRVDAIKGRAVSDLKTTMNASMMAFAYDSKKFLYRISGSYYLEIISEVTEILHNDFYLIPCEKSEPWECAVYKISPQSLEKAQIEIRQALQMIRTILDQGEKAWKGYALGIKELAI